jgi:hypothetical protein
MATGGRIALGLRVTLLAASAIFLAPATAVAQSCSPNDWWNAIQSAASVITSGACASACSDGVGCAAAGAIAASLGGVSADASQATVNQFCSAVQTAINDAQNAGGDVGTIQSLLSQVGISSQSVTGPILSALNGIGDPLNVAECGCQLENGIGQLGGALLGCLQTAICGLQEDLGWGACGCTPPPPTAANCTPPPVCISNPGDPQCGNVIYGNPQTNPPPVNVTQLSNGGTFVLDNVDGWDGHSQTCTPDSYCYCPSPLILKKTPVPYFGDGTVMYSCACPPNTTASATSGPGAEICICNVTKQVAVPPVKSEYNPDGSDCPIPLTGIPCPQAGQVRMNGQCVTPCSNPNEGMTMDGACCDPNQVTACGQCCPPGSTPEPNGTCFTPGQAQ